MSFDKLVTTLVNGFELMGANKEQIVFISKEQFDKNIRPSIVDLTNGGVSYNTINDINLSMEVCSCPIISSICVLGYTIHFCETIA